MSPVNQQEWAVVSEHQSRVNAHNLLQRWENNGQAVSLSVQIHLRKHIRNFRVSLTDTDTQLCDRQFDVPKAK